MVSLRIKYRFSNDEGNYVYKKTPLENKHSHHCYYFAIDLVGKMCYNWAGVGMHH